MVMEELMPTQQAEETRHRSLKRAFNQLVCESTEHRFVEPETKELSVENVTKDAQEIAAEILADYVPDAPHNANERVFAAIAEYTKAMGGLHGNFLDLVKTDVENFEKKTKELQSQMRWQGKAVVALASLSFALAICGAAIPEATRAATTPTLPSRLNALGLGDHFQNALRFLTTKLRDNSFMRETCKSGSAFFHTASMPANSFLQAKTTEIESKRNLLERFNLQDGQSKKSMFETQVQLAQQAAQRILESKSRSG